jgi:hypothetical protein
MAKVIEKRDWLNIWAKCATIQYEMEKCVLNSNEYKNLRYEERNNIRKITDSFVMNYLSNYISKSPKNLVDMNSDSFKIIADECNFAKLNECCKENFNLESLKGYYESTTRKLPKVVEIDEKEMGDFRYKIKK